MYPPEDSAARESVVARVRTVSSPRPCTSCSSCTVNSTSRSPPGPSLIWRSRSASGMFSVTRRRMACTDSTKPSRSAEDQMKGAIASS